MPYLNLLKTAKINFQHAASRNKWEFANPVELNDTFALKDANGEVLKLKKKTELLTLATGGLTSTHTGWIPAGAMVMACVGRVTTTITGATANLSLGGTGVLTAWCNAKASKLAAGSTIASYVDGAATAPNIFAAATDLVFTSSTGNFTAGKVRVTLFYYDLTAPTS